MEHEISALAIATSELRDTALDFKLNNLRQVIDTNQQNIAALLTCVQHMQQQMNALTTAIAQLMPLPPAAQQPPDSTAPTTRQVIGGLYVLPPETGE